MTRVVNSKKYRLIAIVLLFVFPTTILGAIELDSIKRKVRAKFPTVKQMTINEFQNLSQSDRGKNLILLDVREPEEYNVSHIKTAKLSTDIADAQQILANIPKDTTIVAYCSVGYRSSDLVEKLNDLGYNNAYNLEGSIFEWANTGFPVYNEGKQVFKVHPYNRKWGKLLDSKFHP